MVTLIVAIALLLFLLGFMGERVANLYRYYQSSIGVEFDLRIIQAIIMKSIFEVLIMLVPIVLSTMVTGTVGNVTQFGFIFTTKPTMPNLSKINPLRGPKDLFSLKKLIENAKITLKMGVVFIIALIALLQFIKEFLKVEFYSLAAQVVWLRNKALILAAIVIIAFLIIAILDVFSVRFQYPQGLKIGKQEIKDGYEQIEGDPQVKGRIHRSQMEAARRRMVQDVVGADMVITNPTHHAVALYHDTTKENALRVVAKGVDFPALRIKETAYRHNVTVYENPPLARQLYRDCNLDQFIPRKLFKAVGEVFKFVYQANKKEFLKS